MKRVVECAALTSAEKGRQMGAKPKRLFPLKTPDAGRVRKARQGPAAMKQHRAGGK